MSTEIKIIILYAVSQLDDLKSPVSSIENFVVFVSVTPLFGDYGVLNNEFAFAFVGWVLFASVYKFVLHSFVQTKFVVFEYDS